jgi:ethanolamine utilization microcompartment shell protein EutS
MMIGKVAYLDIFSGMLLLLNYTAEVRQQLLRQLLLLSAMDRCSGAVGVMYGDLS